MNASVQRAVRQFGTRRSLRCGAMDDLVNEADRATEMLKGRSVRLVRRHRANEVLIEFEDGTRLVVDSQSPVELSITGDFPE